MFESTARGAVMRTAAIYTPLFVASLAVMLLMVVGVWEFAIVLFVIMAIVAFLFGYQSIQALRDLRSEMRTSRGPVLRLWSKRDVFVSKSYYVAVNRSIFRIPLPSYWDLREEVKRLREAELDDEFRVEVEVLHYPHTGAVEWIKKVGEVRIAPPTGPTESLSKTTREA